jgi:hypothetical protein
VKPGKRPKQELVRLPMPLKWKSDADPTFNLQRCDRIVRSTIEPLIAAEGRAGITTAVIFPSHPVETAHENVLAINGRTPFLLHLYRSDISAAIEANDAQRACLLGYQLGQFVAGLPLREVVKRGRAAQVSGGKRDPKKQEKRNRNRDEFKAFVRDRYREYEKREGTKRATISDFRESVIRPLVDVLKASDGKNDRAFGKRLMGTKGIDGDQLMSTKQLGRYAKSIIAAKT